MNKSVLRKVSLSVAGSFALSFFAFLVSSILFPSPEVLKCFYIDNAFKWALLYCIEYAIPIHITGVLLGYSVFVNSRAIESIKGSLVPRLVSSVLIFFMGLTVIYIVVLLWLQPILVSSVNENGTKSGMARQYYALAKEELVQSENAAKNTAVKEKEQHLRNAFRYIQSAVFLAPGYTDAVKFENEVRQKIVAANIPVNDVVEENDELKTGDNRKIPEEMTVDQLMEKAREFYTSENYFSAYYYAAMAFKFDGTRLDAKKLSIEAMNRISSNELSQKDEGIKNFYRRKKEGYNKIISGEYVAAYYIFLELAESHPDDMDVADYLKKVKTEFLDKYTFFYDEVKNLDSNPGHQGILFINYSDREMKEFIAIDKMVIMKEGIFFRNIEVMDVNIAGVVTSHIKAPFGKYVFADISGITKMGNRPATKHHVNLNCIFPDNNAGNGELKESDISPQFIVKPEEGNAMPFLIPLYKDKYRLKDFIAGRSSFKSVGLLDLFSLTLDPEYANAGYDRTAVNIELINRFLLPFIFLFCSLISIALGWATRSAYPGRPPVLTIIFIPVFPFVLAFLAKLYSITQNILFGFIALHLDIILVLVICLVFQSITILAALLIISGKLAK